MKNSILAVGKKDTVLGFSTIGIDTLFWEESHTSFIALQDRLENSHVSIVFYTEDIQIDIQPILKKYKKTLFPIFTVIPSLEKEQTQGKKDIENLVLQALGSASIEK